MRSFYFPPTPLSISAPFWGYLKLVQKLWSYVKATRERRSSLGIELGLSRTQKGPTDKGTIGELISKKAGTSVRISRMSNKIVTLSLKIIASVSYFWCVIFNFMCAQYRYRRPLSDVKVSRSDIRHEYGTCLRVTEFLPETENIERFQF